LRTSLLLGNSSDPSDEKTDFSAVESGAAGIGENSKTVYINDSYNLDEIPFDTSTIIDLDDNEDDE
jgi:hypothetical protein